MPSTFSTLDTSFPNLEGKSTEQKLQTMTDYLYQLLEQLRYTLRNLGEENFNPTDLQHILEPIHAEIADEVNGLSTRIDADETGIQTLVTKTGINSLGQNETLYSGITQNAGAISSEVSRATGAEGTLGSRITQTADAITAEVTRATTAEGTLSSSVSQNAQAITTKVSKNGVISSINQTSEQITIDANKVNLSGYVTFTNLSTSGQTSINGGNITSGTISGVTLISSDGGPGALSPSDVVISNGGIDLKYGGDVYGSITIGDAMGNIYFDTYDGYSLRLGIDGWAAGSASGSIVLDGGVALVAGKNYGTQAQRDAIAYPDTGQLFFVI